ncbi:hypothetical protein BIV23_26090 [Streptomyces monashensis]|uniref:DUF6571 domain-containing protein n=2 Tax=Streptomyces monashensis TaxID=1678012 RepID=A0A1S2Q636_9ACTN|nr:hypothetical protein BIV23_26090 [Streptomyces monashensis]
MQSMITSYNKDKSDLRNSVTNIKSRFDRFGIDSGDLTQILGICNWLDDQLSTLTRHQVLGAALERENPGLTMVQVPEPVVSAAQARKDGKDLADRMNKIDGTGDSAEQYHEIAQQLAAHKDDPDYCSAFYAAISPNIAQNLPTFLSSTGSSTAGEDLKAYSQALGSACSDGYPAPGFDKVKKLYLTPPPKGDNALAWNRGAMLQYGQFPADFLSRAARVNVLDSFAKDHDQNLSLISQNSALGLPSNTMTLYLNALGTNGDATRDALAHMGGTGSGTDLQGNLKSLIAYANQSHDPDMTNALKSALTAGSGDQVTHGADGSLSVVPTMHGGYEADFAATAMSSLAQSHADYKTYKDYIDTTFTAYGTPPGAHSDQKGAQDAFLLHLATAGDPTWPPTRPAIIAVGKDADALKGDTDFMSGFYSQGGDRFEAQVASSLHAEDGTHNGQVLSKDSQNILAEFGANLAAATKLEASGKIPTGLTQTFTNPPDMWSATMLMKYGPKGGEWDPGFLSSMGDAVLHWRKAHDMRPIYVDGQTTLAGYVPGGFADPKNAWYSELGLKENAADMTGDEQFAIVQGIDDNDPSLAVLSKLADNADASRTLLSGKDGSFAAQQLVNDHWATPGTDFDDAKFPAAIITAATSDREHHAKDAAVAAANIINAGAAKYADDKNKSSDDKILYPVNTEIEKSLAFVFSTYVHDFAASTGTDQKAASPNGDGTIKVPRGTTLAFLSEILENKDKDCAGNVIQAINAQVRATSQLGVEGDNGDYINKLAELRGEISKAGHNVDMDEAALADAEHAKQLLWFNIVTSAAASVPLPGGAPAVELAEKWAQAAIWTGIPYGGSKFPSGAQAAAEADYQGMKFSESTSMAVPLMEGLAKSGKLQQWQVPPPPGHPEWVQGHIVIKNDDDRDAFNTWWLNAQKHGGLAGFDQQMREAFSLGAS